MEWARDSLLLLEAETTDGGREDAPRNDMCLGASNEALRKDDREDECREEGRSSDEVLDDCDDRLRRAMFFVWGEVDASG
jgi:hypothetical protein